MEAAAARTLPHGRDAEPDRAADGPDCEVHHADLEEEGAGHEEHEHVRGRQQDVLEDDGHELVPPCQLPWKDKQSSRKDKKEGSKKPTNGTTGPCSSTTAPILASLGVCTIE